MTEQTDNEPKLTLAEAIKRRDAIEANPEGNDALEQEIEKAKELCVDLNLSTDTPRGEARRQTKLSELLDKIDAWIRDERSVQSDQHAKRRFWLGIILGFIGGVIIAQISAIIKYFYSLFS